MLSKSLFTAIIVTAGNVANCGSMPKAENKIFSNNTTFDYNTVKVTATVYDIPSNVVQLAAPAVPTNPVTFSQQPYTLRNRVSYTQYYNELKNNSSVVDGATVYTPIYSNYTTGTYYAYDIHGNVDTLLQDYRQGAMADHGFNRFKEMRRSKLFGKINNLIK